MSIPRTDPASAAKQDTRRLRRAVVMVAGFVALLWLIKLIELALGLDLAIYGVYPGQTKGLFGLFPAPLIHGSLLHLFANTAPLLVLGIALLYGYPKAARLVIPFVYLGAGLGVWLFARPAYHIGASGLTFGMLFFVFTMGVLRWDRKAIALSLVVFFLYGGMIWGIFPSQPGISFEYHFFGAMIGVVLAIALRKRDPPPPEKRYSWEEEGEEMELEEWLTKQREE